MKKLGTISFLLILIFNTCGYKFVLFVLEKKATQRLEKRIEARDYDASELIELRIPLNLPYYIGWQDYKVEDGGEVVIDGSVFQYLKRRVFQDTLFLTCIYHSEKTRLQHAGTDYAKRINDFPSGGATQSSNSYPAIKLMMTEYLHDLNILHDLASGKQTNSYNSYRSKYFSQFAPLIPVPPPKG